MTRGLVLETVCGGYGDTRVVHGMSGGVAPGEVLGVLGRNGAGKTTLARLASGALPLQAGSVRLDGRDLGRDPAHVRRRAGLGHMPQTGFVFDSLSVGDNLAIATTRGAPDAVLDCFPVLRERGAQPAGTLSGGERKLLGFARTILEDTAVVVLDEPSEGVQPENIERMAACLRARAAEGAAVLLLEQNVAFLHAVADRYLVVETGRVADEGAVADESLDSLRARVTL
ncbi:MAG: ATP-binding cassette domain-containing protein [Pseudomonadota bacterium]